jgi:transcriptional regulator of heat shock response
LGINNLLRDDMLDDYHATKNIIKFIEDKRVVKFLDKKMIKRWHIYYTFIEDHDIMISAIYTKVLINDYDCIISIVWPTRVDYKKNVSILRKIMQSIWT